MARDHFERFDRFFDRLWIALCVITVLGITTLFVLITILVVQTL